MPAPTPELADIFRIHGPAYRKAHALPLHQHRLMQAIVDCRTPALGGTVEWCDHCQFTHTRYRSCRNRHCPKCQGDARHKWLEQRRQELLPVPYFHVVFTLPEEIAAIAFYNKDLVYDLLFAATAETLLTIARDPQHQGVEIGFFAVLHTWGQNLHFHPHLHCVVPGGGLSPDHDRWIHGRGNYLLPVEVLSRFFRKLFLRAFQRAYSAGKLQFFGDLEYLRDPAAWAAYLAPLHRSDWVIYAKAPFGGPQQVLEYLGRYTHRVAISNQRLRALEDGQVSFEWKDYRDGQSKVMTLAAEEFIRRFRNTPYRRVSSAFATTGSWPIAIVPRNWPSAAACSPHPAPISCPARPRAARSPWLGVAPTPSCVRAAASASWSLWIFCRPAVAPLWWWRTPHDSPGSKLALACVWSLRQAVGRVCPAHRKTAPDAASHPHHSRVPPDPHAEDPSGTPIRA